MILDFDKLLIDHLIFRAIIIIKLKTITSETSWGWTGPSSAQPGTGIATPVTVTLAYPKLFTNYPLPIYSLFQAEALLSWVGGGAGNNQN